MVLLKLRGENYLEDNSDVVNSRELFEHQKCLWMAGYEEKELIGLCGCKILKQVNHKSGERLLQIKGEQKVLKNYISCAAGTEGPKNGNF